MANIVYIQLKEERKLELKNKELVCDQDYYERTAYICCDSLTCWLGNFDTVEDLMELVGPDNILETIKENLSDIESSEIISVLEYNDYKYKLDYFDNDFLIAKEN